MRVKPKTLLRHARRRKVQIFQGRLIFRRMQQCQFHRPINVQRHGPIFVVQQMLPPAWIFHESRSAVVMPVFGAFHAAHLVHFHMGRSVVRGHRFLVGIVPVIHPRFRIHVDPVIVEFPSAIPCSAAFHQRIDLFVGLDTVMLTAATGQKQRGRQHQNCEEERGDSEQGAGWNAKYGTSKKRFPVSCSLSPQPQCVNLRMIARIYGRDMPLLSKAHLLYHFLNVQCRHLLKISKKSAEKEEKLPCPQTYRMLKWRDFIDCSDNTDFLGYFARRRYFL